MVENWLFEDNLKPFVALLAQHVGYRLYNEDYDWVAIEYGLQDTDEHAGKWYSYPLAGTSPVVLEVANNHGSTVISVRVRGEQGFRPELAAQIEVMFDVCQQYSVVPRTAT